MSDIAVYGIPNCDTVKKARAWLAERHVNVTWHDFKKQGVPQPELQQWLEDIGWEKVLNRSGTTWRKLDEAARAAVVDAASAAALMVQQPSVIRRPVVRWADGRVTVGFSDASFSERLGEPL